MFYWAGKMSSWTICAVTIERVCIRNISIIACILPSVTCGATQPVNITLLVKVTGMEQMIAKMSNQGTFPETRFSYSGVSQQTEKCSLVLGFSRFLGALLIRIEGNILQVIVISWPHRARALTTKSRAKTTMLIFAIVHGVLFIPGFYSRKLVRTSAGSFCAARQGNAFHL